MLFALFTITVAIGVATIPVATGKNEKKKSSLFHITPRCGFEAVTKLYTGRSFTL